MKAIQRQLLHGQRRTTALLRAAERPASQDVPVHQLAIPRGGIARIDSNDGDGRYTISEQWWDPDAETWTEATAPLGLAAEDAFDYMGNALGGVSGQFVRFWETRGLQGRIVRLIDVSGGQLTFERVSSFCVHYSGVNETTSTFHTVPGCRFSFIEIAVDVRECSGHVPPADHPGSTILGDTGQGNCPGNCFASWAGSEDEEWTDLSCMVRDENGNAGISPDFHVQFRVTSAGNLEFRVKNDYTSPSNTISVVIAGMVRVTPHPLPPGTVEIGNCCCHEAPPGVWGDGEWSG